MNMRAEGTVEAPIFLGQDNFAEVTAGMPAQARMALSVLMRMPKGMLSVETPEGGRFQVGGNGPGPRAHVRLNNWRLAARAFSGGTIGVAESYIDGDWESDDVTAFLKLFIINGNQRDTVAGGASRVIALVQKIRHWLNENTRTRARRNIAAHYDLGNAFYEQWLDASMTYSSALFSTGANDLESAQQAKYRAIARAAGVGPGDRVLEIGCGWGGFAEYAAREIGCHVTGLTISREQYDFASARLARAGLSDRADIALRDYRDETGRYDRIVSIEMFEAVGERYWPVFFEGMKRALKPGGTAGLQVITIRDDEFEDYRSRPDFIQRYVFPGGMLPSPSILRRLGDQHGLSCLRESVFAQDYARTLAEWRARFHTAWERIAPLGFDERFRRLWNFYLHYCEAGFSAGQIDVRQVVYEA